MQKLRNKAEKGECLRAEVVFDLWLVNPDNFGSWRCNSGSEVLCLEGFRKMKVQNLVQFGAVLVPKGWQIEDVRWHMGPGDVIGKIFTL